jgi:hypothetical protein
METPDQYREFAVECYRLASVARTEEHRKILRPGAHWGVCSKNRDR